MPHGKLDLNVPLNCGRPKFDEIFKLFGHSKILKVKAELKKKDKTSWRPSGLNSYEIQIISIELLPGSNRFSKNFKLTGVLLGMNGNKNVFPQNFSWGDKAIKNEVRLLFSKNYKMTLQYEEYINL